MVDVETDVVRTRARIGINPRPQIDPLTKSMIA
jgi:hypothetical protein